MNRFSYIILFPIRATGFILGMILNTFWCGLHSGAVYVEPGERGHW